jgi:esterase/lipase superfamily enzyme
MPETKITEQTDLTEDLLADPMDVAEVVSMLCEGHGVTPPKAEMLTRLSAVRDYIVSAKQKPTGGVILGPRGRGEDKQGLYVQEVYYGTSRRPEPSDHFSGKRGLRGQELKYGRCEVTIPVAAHKKGQIERPSFLKLEFKEDPAKHIVLRKVEALTREQFLLSIDGRVKGASADEPSGKDGFVFVHGYNVTFDKAARRTAQITYDLDFPGVPIFFSWPSDGRFLSYLSDREDAEWSVPYLERFLMEISTQSPIRKIHLIAHSMGNQCLIRALLRIALKLKKPDRPLFENVVLAAPDFDAGVFTDQVAPQVLALANRWTVYASDKDKALDASTVLAAKRLGLPLSVASGVDTVDASGIDVTPWNVPEFHSYYASKKRAIRDMAGILAGLAPDKRNLVPKEKDRMRYWELPPL